jgi:hypothetical protein
MILKILFSIIMYYYGCVLVCSLMIIPTVHEQFSLSHAVNCCRNGSLIKRHNSVLYAMIRCAEVVGVALTPEVRISPVNSLLDAVGQGLLPNQSFRHAQV